MVEFNKLFESVCTLTFEMEDGSRVCSLTTLSPAMLRMYDLQADALYDITERKPIPEKMMQYLVSVEEGNTTAVNLSKLDKIFLAGGKSWW